MYTLYTDFSDRLVFHQIVAARRILHYAQIAIKLWLKRDRWVSIRYVFDATRCRERAKQYVGLSVITVAIFRNQQLPMKQSLKSEITAILYSAPIVENLARKNFVSLFLLALIQQRRVQFCELASVLNDEAKIASNQNRIEDFFREVTINYQAVARLIMTLLPKHSKLRLTIDRTE